MGFGFNLFGPKADYNKGESLPQRLTKWPDKGTFLLQKEVTGEKGLLK